MMLLNYFEIENDGVILSGLSCAFRVHECICIYDFVASVLKCFQMNVLLCFRNALK